MLELKINVYLFIYLLDPLSALSRQIDHFIINTTRFRS